MTRSSHRLKENVRETVSELPIHAARLAVMGVGQALLLTDRVRKDYKEARTSGLGPVLGRLREDAESLTGKVVGKVVGRSDDGQGPAPAEPEIVVGKPTDTRARPATASAKPSPTQPGPAATRPAPSAPPKGSAPSAPPKPASPPKPAEPASASPKAETATPGPTTGTGKASVATPAAAAKELPVSGYDEATLASVRARLRNLSVKQVTELRDHERAHKARAEFLRMFENRIAKLRSGD